MQGAGNQGVALAAHVGAICTRGPALPRPCPWEAISGAAPPPPRPPHCRRCRSFQQEEEQRIALLRDFQKRHSGDYEAQPGFAVDAKLLRNRNRVRRGRQQMR